MLGFQNYLGITLRDVIVFVEEHPSFLLIICFLDLEGNIRIPGRDAILLYA